MLSPRRPSKVPETDFSNPADRMKSSGAPRTPVKRLAEKETTLARSPAKRSPTAATPAPQPLISNSPRPGSAPVEAFISSTPTPRRKQLKENVRPRPGRLSTGTLFSPPYPATVSRASCPAECGGPSHTSVGHNTSPQSCPVSPTPLPLSPVRRSLQENLARYGHIEQEFDEYEIDQFDPYQFIASLHSTMTPSRLVRRTMVALPPRKPEAPRITLVLDLDETLVHCSTDPNEIPKPDFCFQVEFNGVVYSVCAKKRPGFEEFMEHIKDRFEIVVFTASQRVYAEKLLDILDPFRDCIAHRLYRDDCMNVDGNYLKDLSSLGRELSQTVILDNSPQAFSLQLDNGIPILSWWNRPDDRELFKICPLLDRLASANDVRPLLREKFQLHRKVEEKMAGCESVLPPKALDYC